MNQVHVFSRDVETRWKKVIWSCAAERGPLLTRYYLINTRWFAIYLHHLQASDEDRALHDHPWWFVTYLLSGGYWEHVPCTCAYCREQPDRARTVSHWRGRFSVLFRPAEWQHRLELVRPMWTLVVRGPYIRPWGFITRNGWQDWRAYGKEWCD